MKINKYIKFLENIDNEKYVILNNIIPEINDSYEKLSMWAKNKINVETEPILKLIFEKKDESWLITLVIRNWAYNSSNRLIIYVFSDSIKDIFKKHKIGFSGDLYVGSIFVNSDQENIIYNNITKKEE